MDIASVNPYSGQTEKTFAALDDTALETIVQRVSSARTNWSTRPIDERAACFRRTAHDLRARTDELSALISREMGKPIREARAEIEKCAWGCEVIAEHAPGHLADEQMDSDATTSLITYQPLGTVLAIMPWNFPFWQVFRACVPALVAGNTVILKHASNVPQCALAIERLLAANLPPDVFRTVLIHPQQAEPLIGHPLIHAVTLTGSETAGRRVAAAAGAGIKKTVLELGGSDPFVVLADADLDLAVAAAVTSRFQNGGQSCIAAKRLVLVPEIADAFVSMLAGRLSGLRSGDPLSVETDLGPMARADLRDQLQHQVTDSIALGARVVAGCRPEPGPGFFYPPSILDHVQPGMPAFDDELFGPVAAIVRAVDEADAVQLANRHRYGLGGSVWTRDVGRGEAVARRLECGQAFVNGVVKSDPRLPFGGIKASGYGRELAVAGVREFVNIKTLWIR